MGSTKPSKKANVSPALTEHWIFTAMGWEHFVTISLSEGLLKDFKQKTLHKDGLKT